jgi:hypothetical protein
MPGAPGTPLRGLRGFVDAHLHTANERAGGQVIYGDPLDRGGIAAALDDDASEHGAAPSGRLRLPLAPFPQ